MSYQRRKLGRVPTERPGPRAQRPAPARAGALLLAPLLLGWAASCADTEPSSAAPGPARDPLRVDPRVDELIYKCERNEPYLRDTSDMLPILVEKLVSGHKEPLRRAKEELMGLGERAAVELERVVQRYFGAEQGGPYLQNALDVLGSIQSPTAHRALLRGLEHPTSEVRHRALRGLSGQPGDPADYDRLRLHLDIEPAELQPLVARALVHADPARASREFLSWIGEGAREGLWRHLGPLLVGSDDPEVYASAARLSVDAPDSIRASLLVLAQRGGDLDAARQLEEMATHEQPQVRTGPATALGQLGAIDRIVELLRNDPSSEVRIAAAAVLGALGDSEVARNALTDALNDGSVPVRSVAQETLLLWGDSAAADRVLNDLLSPSPQILRAALDALREPMRQQPEIARAAYEKMAARYERLAGRSFASRKLTLQVLGQVPTAESVDLLLAEVPALQSERIDGMDAHGWCTLQASNAGPPGQARLVARLSEEVDPVRRLDLIWAIGTQRNEVARATLLELLDRAAEHPLEVLFVADVLTKLGPAHRVAPKLKQTVLRIQDNEARLALQCLLWRWY